MLSKFKSAPVVIVISSDDEKETYRSALQSAYDLLDVKVQDAAARYYQAGRAGLKAAEVLAGTDQVKLLAQRSAIFDLLQAMT
jgi:hypothetical protein